MNTMNDWLRATQFKSLNSNETHVWLYALDLTTPSIKRFYPLLSDDEKERSEQLIHFIHRKRFIAAHGFLRSVLSLYLNEPAENIRLGKGTNGKPFINNGSLHFNLSHSQQLAMLAIHAQHEVGIDTECLDRKNEWQKIIRRFFTPDEQAAISGLKETEQRRAFFQVWTRKEAHMKVTGKGLHLSPSRFSVSVPPEPARILHDPSKPEQTHYEMQDIILPESLREYCACVSVENSIGDLRKFVFQ
jgi:4'-phosphopantetheinyl transferase